jgi:hypothetical protein
VLFDQEQQTRIRNERAPQPAAAGNDDRMVNGGACCPQQGAALQPVQRTRAPSGDLSVQRQRDRTRLNEGRNPRAPNQNQNVTNQDLENRRFRQFREVDVNRLRESLPPQARHLAQSFIDAGRRHNIDPLVLAAISRHETANFTSSAFRNKNNAMGVSDRRGPRRMQSHQQSIDYMAQRLASPTGPYRNAQNLRQLWHVYAPPSTQRGGRPVENDPGDVNRHWGAGVERFIRFYENAVR